MQCSTLKRNPSYEFSGEWKFVADPTDAGRREEWYEPDATWPDSRTVSVPHAWQEHDDLRGYAGAAWYRRTVTIDALGDSERALLYFGAADPKDRPPLVFPPELPIGVTEVFGEFVGRTLGLRGIGVKALVGDTEREKRTGLNRDST